MIGRYSSTPITEHLLQPFGEVRVELGPTELGNGLVCRIADQLVAEPVRLATHQLRTLGRDELTPGQGHQRGTHRLALRLRGELGHRVAMEERPLHRASLQDAPLGLNRGRRGAPPAGPGSSAGRRTAERSPLIVQRPSSRASAPSSISLASISSTNSGLPSAAARIRSNIVVGRSARPRSCSTSSPVSSALSGSSVTWS